MSEQEPPQDQPLFHAERRRALWGWKIVVGSLLAFVGLWAGYLALRELGVHEPSRFLPVLFLLVIGFRFLNRVLTGKGSASPTEDIVLFSSPYRQVQPGVVTDDVSIHLPAGWTTERVVDLVLAAAQRGASFEEVVSALVASGLSMDDALLAIDRALGGLVRARTGNPRNEPSRTKDPIAWTSYHRGLKDPALVAAGLHPADPGGQAAMGSMPSGAAANLERARALVAARLSRIYGTWTVEPDKVLGPPGPPGLAVFVSEDRCGQTQNGILLGFSVSPARSEPILIWDCAHGAGRSNEEALEDAVDIWAQSTAVTLLELCTRGGAFADHFRDADWGLPGWHLIQGPVITRGVSERASSLGKWLADHPLIPQLADALAAAGLPRDEPTGMKLYLGSSSKGEDVAEVRVNQVIHPQLSAALAALPWPRLEEPAYARVFVLFVHRE